MKKQHFLLAAFFYVVTVLYLAGTTPISPHEAKYFYVDHSLVTVLMHAGDSLSHTLFGLRIVFILAGFLSVWLLYEYSRGYFEKCEDAYMSTFIFMLLPGILTGTILANVAILVLPLVLLFVLFYEKNYLIPLPFIMLALFFIHEASIFFFVALLLYGLIHKDKKLAGLSVAFILAFIYLAKGITIDGRPSGHFVEIFGLYAAVFSPLVFFYFFYVMYRILLRGKKTLLWYISFTALLFSLLLSIRQRVNITDFAPYILIAVPLMLKLYNSSLRVRLPEFRKRYIFGFNMLIITLIVSIFTMVSYHTMFYISKNPTKFFTNKVYAPYFLAKELKSKGIECYDVTNERERYQLQYYNISPCTTNPN